MSKQLFTTFLLFSNLLLLGQTPPVKSQQNIGIYYFGELGIRPGIEIDYGWNLWQKEKEKTKRIITNQFNLRPSFTYYRYAHYSNNMLLSVKANYHLRYVNKANEKYLFIEPFLRIGYLRYFLAGDVFETQNNGFNKVGFRGSNAFIFGSAFDSGGFLTKRLDWLFGFDYFAERTADKLTLHRFGVKLGTRIKLNVQ